MTAGFSLYGQISYCVPAGAKGLRPVGVAAL